jgi:hypothetical protein
VSARPRPGAAPAAVLPSFDDATVRRLAQRVLGRPAGRVRSAWALEPVLSRLQPATRIYRLRVAPGTGEGEAWTAILKVVPPKATPEERREVRVYRSGLLDALPAGLRAPRCYWVQERADGSAFLWLEDVLPPAPERWGVARLALAARHLGRWNGGYLVGAPFPARPYLSKRWLDGWIEANAAAIARLAEWKRQAPVLRAYSPAVSERILDLWGRRGPLLEALARLPATLCHFDAHPGNLIMARREAHEETVLLDWQFLGPGPLGADAAPLLGAPLTEGLLPAGEAPALARAVFDGYLAGLQEAGWHRSAPLARAGYVGVAGLRYTLGTTRFLLPLLGDPPAMAEMEATLGLREGSLAPTMAALFPFFLSLADEATALLAEAGLLRG